jgi:hypothetical protein
MAFLLAATYNCLREAKIQISFEEERRMSGGPWPIRKLSTMSLGLQDNSLINQEKDLTESTTARLALPNFSA